MIFILPLFLFTFQLINNICSLANISARLTFGCIYWSMALLSMQAMEWPHACTVLSHGISHSRSYGNYPQLWKLGVYNLDCHFEISVARFKWKKVNDTCSSLSKTNPQNEGGNWFSFDIAITGQANVCGKGTFNHGYWSLLSHSPDFRPNSVEVGIEVIPNPIR